MTIRQRAFGVSLAMLLVGLTAVVMTPTDRVPIGAVALERMIPSRFGDWVEEQVSVDQVPTEVGRRTDQAHDRPLYDQVLMRTYRRTSDGKLVMLALAYGRRQLQEFKIHRPELCYYSQGFDVKVIGGDDVSLDTHVRVASHQLLARSRTRFEPITYWIRIGNSISPSAWETRWILLKDGIAGYVPDGILVRASSLIERDSEIQPALRVQGMFLSDLYSSLSPQARIAIAGS